MEGVEFGVGESSGRESNWSRRACLIRLVMTTNDLLKTNETGQGVGDGDGVAFGEQLCDNLITYGVIELALWICQLHRSHHIQLWRQIQTVFFSCTKGNFFSSTFQFIQIAVLNERLVGARFTALVFTSGIDILPLSVVRLEGSEGGEAESPGLYELKLAVEVERPFSDVGASGDDAVRSHSTQFDTGAGTMYGWGFDGAAFVNDEETTA